MTRPLSDIPLIVHVIHRFDVGGLENGVVNLINNMPAYRYRHAIVCLQGYTEFRNRLKRNDVNIYDMAKKNGHDFGLYLRLFQIFRKLKPAIVHSRNLSALESHIVAALVGIRGRVHGEHGRDIYDLHGKNWKHNQLRKLVRPLVHHYITVSKDLQSWLINTIGVSHGQVSQIYNGVDIRRFSPRQSQNTYFGPPGFFSEGVIIIGSVGRMVAVKDYPNLVKAFLRLLELTPTMRDRMRLLIVGDGETYAACMEMLKQHSADHLAWFPGERADIPELMATMDIFVLPSLGEGISNTILEAMATSLPVIATKVGGNVELVQEGKTGFLVQPADPDAMAQALLHYVLNPDQRQIHGLAARDVIERRFSIDAMIHGYVSVYDRILNK